MYHDISFRSELDEKRANMVCAINAVKNVYPLFELQCSKYKQIRKTIIAAMDYYNNPNYINFKRVNKIAKKLDYGPGSIARKIYKDIEKAEIILNECKVLQLRAFAEFVIAVYRVGSMPGAIASSDSVQWYTQQAIGYCNEALKILGKEQLNIDKQMLEAKRFVEGS